MEKKTSSVFFCGLCNMQFPNKKLHEAHKKQEAHVAKSKEHGVVGNKSDKDRSGIYVRGYPENTKENGLIKYFSQFGSVIWAHFGHDFLLLDFTESSAVEKVMAKKAHFFHGRRLFVRHKKQRAIDPRVQVNEEQINENTYKQIIDTLQYMDNFDPEFLYLARTLQPDLKGASRKCSVICQDLYNILAERYRNIRVHPFGSTLTGLGFNNSDVDVYLSNVKDTDDEINHLNVVKRYLTKSGRFVHCFAIPGAKIPIVKCVHRATGIRCDINIKNILGVCNTKLIHYYLSLDIKLKQAMIVLKYWGKCHKITGQNHLFTNYALAMLFIFFLQQQPYRFPTVLSLQQPGYAKYLNIQGVWNGEFVPNYNFHSDKLSYTSLLQLVEQFFAFYAQFPYQTEIICPYLGKALPKTYFNEPKDLPKFYDRYKQYVMSEDDSSQKRLRTESAMCLQDPFEHCRNNTTVITDSVLERFVALCKLGKSICEGRKNVLYKLLTEQPPNLKKPKIQCQEDLLKMSLHKFGSSKEKWFDRVVNFITIALKDFLFLTLTDSDPQDPSPNKSSKNEDQSDIHDSKGISFTCAGKINMWDARKATAKQLNLTNANTTLVERETAITNHLKGVYKSFQDITDILSFKLTMESVKEDEVQIQVKKISAYKKSFKSFAVFFSANIPLWFEIYEKDLSKAPVTN